MTSGVVDYTVTLTEKDTGKGHIEFSHPVNMVWLMSNFDAFFDIYKTDEAALKT